MLKIESVYIEKEGCWGGGKEEGLQCLKRIRFALDNMQVNKNRTKRKQYLVCHESTKKKKKKKKKLRWPWEKKKKKKKKKTSGMSKIKTRKSMAVLG